MQLGKNKIFYGWWVVAACTLIMATYFALLLNCFSLYIVPVTQGLGITRSQLSSFTVIRSAVGMVLSPVAGKLCAKKSVRHVVSLGLLFGCLGYTGISFVNSLPMLYVMAAITGAGIAFSTNVPVAILITRWFVDKRGTAMSIAFAGCSIGAMVLSPIINGIISSFGWRMAFRGLGIFLIFVVVPFCFIILRSKPEDKGLTALGADKIDSVMQKKLSDTKGVPVNKLKKTPVFWLFLVAIFIMQLTMGAMYHMGAHVTQVIDAAAAARFVSISSLIGIFGKLLMGPVFDKWGEKKGILLCVALMILCFVFLLISNTFAMFILVALFYGIGSAHSTIFPPQLTSRTFGSKYYGETYGYVNAATSLAMGLNNAIMAGFYDSTGSYNAAWIFGICCCVVACGLLFTSLKHGKKLIEE